jgi:hypothetical protein
MKLNVIRTRFQRTSDSGKNRTEVQAQLSELKRKLARQLTFRYGNDLSEESVRFAVHEADALSATLPYPLLLFPTLAEEKVFKASQWAEKQRQIASRGWHEAA